MNYKYGINITTYNRPEYLEKMFFYFKKTNFLDNTIIKITDDFSDDKRTTDLVNDFELDNKNYKVKKYFNPFNFGAKLNYLRSVQRFWDEDVDYVVNLDSDAIVNKNWLIEINKMNNIFGPNVLSSVFYCDNSFGDVTIGKNTHEPVNKDFFKKIENTNEYYKTKTLNGICLSFPKFIIKDLFDETHARHFDGLVSHDLKIKYNLQSICTSKSYVEHIGEYGVNSNINFPTTVDKATNFVGVE